MEIAIPKEVLALHRLCAKATEEGTPGMAKMRLLFNKNTGRAQVTNGILAAEATWTDPELGLDGEKQVSLLGADAKHLAGMAGEDQVLYNEDMEAFTCGGFTLPSITPTQKTFKFMDEALDGALQGLQPKGVKGTRFEAKAFKTLVDLVAKIADEIPLVFYGEKRPACCEVEKGEVAFRFLAVPRSS